MQGNSTVQYSEQRFTERCTKLSVSRTRPVFSSDRTAYPCSRYYYNDGIHLSRSGIKRLIDALNRHVDIVNDFQLCVFQGSNISRKGIVAPVTRRNRNYGQTVDGNRRHGFNMFNGHRQNNRRCYGCSMPGHILAQCWNIQQGLGTIADSELYISFSVDKSNHFSIFEHLCSECSSFQCTCPNPILVLQSVSNNQDASMLSNDNSISVQILHTKNDFVFLILKICLNSRHRYPVHFQN